VSDARGPAGSVLERNLELLFARAYVPVRASPEFRRDLARRLEDEILDRDRSPSARFASGSSLTRSRARSWTLRAAAAVFVLLAGAAAWRALAPVAPHENRAAALERMAAAGETALSIDESDVRAASKLELARGIEFAGGELAAWTAPRSDLSIRLGDAGRLSARESTHVELAGAPASALDVRLEHGSIEVERRVEGDAWRIATRAGTIALERGELVVDARSAASAVANGGANGAADGSGDAGAADARSIQLFLRSGAAHVDANGERLALALGVETELRDGRLVASGKSAPVTDTDTARAPIEAVKTEPAPPLANTTPSCALHGKISFGTSGTPASLPARYSISLLRDERLPAVSMPEVHTFENEPRELAREFDVEHLRAGTYTIFAQAAGFAVWQRANVDLSASDAAITIDLERGRRVSGRVIDAESGRPIEGAVVLSQRDAPAELLPLSMERPPEGWLAAAVSGPNGVFELDALSRGVHRLRTTHAGFAAAWSEAIDLSPLGDRDDVELRMPRGGTVFGHVTHKDGTVWSGAVIVASRIEYDFTQHCMSYGQGTSDADGAFTIEDLPAGPYVVLNVLEPKVEHVASPRVIQVTLAAGARAEVDLTSARKGTRLDGRIAAAHGVVPGDVDVILEPKVEHALRRRWQSERAEHDGSFHFVELAPGAYDVYISTAMGKTFTLEDSVDVPAVPEFAYVLHVGSDVVRGRVFDRVSDRGLADSVLILEIDRDGGYRFAGRAVADAEGRYEARDLPRGTYRITAFATTGRFGPESREGIIVGDGAAPSIDVALSLGAALELEVASDDRRPIADAALTFTDENGRRIQFTPEDLTDDHGRFSVRGLRPGRWIVAASHAGWNAATTTIDLEVGEERTIEITLSPTKTH
jgi:hypothetical protein